MTVVLALITLSTAADFAAAVLLGAGALAALLTTPRRAELRRLRGTIDDLARRVELLEDELARERAQRRQAERRLAELGTL